MSCEALAPTLVADSPIGGLFILGLVVLVAARGAPAALRAVQSVGREATGDRPARVLARAVRGLPPDRADWGTAMSAELVGVQGSGARWGFSLGCAKTAIAMRARAAVAAPDRGGNFIRASMLAAVAATVGLGVFGLVRYPGLRTGVGTWLSVTAFLMIVLVYAVAALALSRGRTSAAAIARGYGFAGGLVVGGGWMLILVPLSKTFFFVPLLVALSAPVGVAAFAGRSSFDPAVGRAAALWSGLVGGLLVFIVSVTVAYAGDGRPYDPQMLREFRASGSHDLAAYAVGDDLGAALAMLVIIPVVALALGSLAGARASATTRARPTR